MNCFDPPLLSTGRTLWLYFPCNDTDGSLGAGMARIGLWVMVALGLAIVATPVLAAKRIALVIGNDAYVNVPKLQKAANDAMGVGAALKGIGYDLILGTNLGRSDMNGKLAELEQRVEPGDIVFIFFAGHGVAIGAENVLLPTDMPAVKQGEAERVRDEGITVDRVIRRIQQKGAATAFLILDACRNNPFEAGGTRDVGSARGLTRTEAPSGVFVLYSAGLGQTALDRLSDHDPEPNSVFTRRLIPALMTPGLSQVALAKRMQVEVSDLAASVSETQSPAYYDQIRGEVAINAGTAAADSVPAPPAQQQAVVAGKPPQRSSAAAPVDACDRLAAPLYQLPKLVDGLALGKIKPEAVAACQQAIQTYPDEHRFWSQLGRAFLAINDRAKAREWFQKAAEAGDGTGLDGIGVIYAQGLGVTKDFAQAQHWLELGAQAGNSQSMRNLCHLFSVPDGGLQDFGKARDWCEQAAAAGNGLAMEDLGIMSEKGTGVPQDFAKAREWHDQASAAGEDRGSRNLAILLDNGRGGPVDYPRAAQLLLAAARAGNAEALRELRGTVAKWNPQTVLELKRELANLRLYKGAVTPGWDAAARTAVEAYLKAQ